MDISGIYGPLCLESGGCWTTTVVGGQLQRSVGQPVCGGLPTVSGGPVVVVGNYGRVVSSQS
jgi:hypothetical protein